MMFVSWAVPASRPKPGNHQIFELPKTLIKLIHKSIHPGRLRRPAFPVARPQIEVYTIAGFSTHSKPKDTGSENMNWVQNVFKPKITTKLKFT